jgi:hypothetical protein
MSKVFARMLRPEDRLQSNVCDYILFKYRGAAIHHSPNEGKRTAFERYLIKVLHVSSGFPDLLIFYKGKMIALELKAGKNTMTPNQRLWLTVLAGYMPTACCWGFDEATKFIDEHLGGLK